MAQTTATVRIDVTVDCEACGHGFQYRKRYQATTGGWTGDRAVAEIKSSIASGDLGFKRCPNCKYLQSWMHESRTKSVTGNAAGIGFLVALVTGPIFKDTSFWPESGWGKAGVLLVNAAIWIGICIAAARFVFSTNSPNARWHKKHGPNSPSPKSPRWQYVK